MFLAHILGIPSGDLRYINERVEIIDDDRFGYDVKEELAEFTLEEINANTLIDSIFHRINRDVFSEIQQQLHNDTLAVSNEAEKAALLRLCEERINEFSPDINSIDSDFNNELDQVTLVGNTLSQIVEEVIPLLLETAQD